MMDLLRGWYRRQSDEGRHECTRFAIRAPRLRRGFLHTCLHFPNWTCTGNVPLILDLTSLCEQLEVNFGSTPCCKTIRRGRPGEHHDRKVAAAPPHLLWFAGSALASAW